MKNILLLLIIFLSFSASYPQSTGTQLIYNSGNYGIALLNSIKPLNTEMKDVYIQLGRFNYFTGVNESGKYLKLDKISNTWFIPLNGSINAAWGCTIYQVYDCQPIPFFAISPIDSNKIIKFVITPAADCPDARTYFTTNCGMNWSTAPFSCGGAIFYPYGGDYNPMKNNELLFGYGNGTSGIFKSTNAGMNWSIICSINGLRQNAGAGNFNSYFMGFGFVKYNPFDTAFVYANGINNINLSTNGGYNFIVLPVKWMKGIIFTSNDSVLYGFNDNRLYRTYNKGLSWDSVQTTVKFSALEVNPDFENILYGGDSSGVYISTNFGNNWSLYNNSFSPSKFVIGISKDPGSADTFYVATTKNVYKVWASFLVGMQNENNFIPDKYVLHQNFPNPFNPTTKIKFDIPLWREKEGRVLSLKIYDILGKGIATLVNEQLQPGTYEVTFDGSNIPSGIYFYKLEIENYIETKKMLMVK